MGQDRPVRGGARAAQRRCGPPPGPLVTRRARERHGAWHDAYGRRELDRLFDTLAKSFSDCTSYEFELRAYDVSGDMAYTVGLEHTSASVDGEPRTYTLRATQTYRREGGEWRVAHRHADRVT
ncbi:nuclear transport factor 2 family protein [Streptomyces sp. CA-179760]|uniref:nuclear transport factor 2 family protein n=1 Tax=Streptomyces sp. CA-179760 TaxID=3240054 RepID=UPI003D8B206A